MLLRSQLHWARHIIRIPDVRYPKRVFYGQLTEGRRKIGAPKKIWKDNLKMSLRSFAIDHSSLETLAGERDVWRASCSPSGRLF